MSSCYNKHKLGLNKKKASGSRESNQPHQITASITLFQKSVAFAIPEFFNSYRTCVMCDHTSVSIPQCFYIM